MVVLSIKHEHIFIYAKKNILKVQNLHDLPSFIFEIAEVVEINP